MNARESVDVTLPAVTMPDPARHGIGLVGCGAIAQLQLEAYRKAGWTVVALCDVRLDAAQRARDEYYPDAVVTSGYAELLAMPEVTVVDLAVHTDIRPGLVRAAIAAGKHVLSQKPFVEDLDEGAELARLAADAGVKLAVNQNGRWAPHFAVLRAAVDSGAIGDIVSADFAAYWPHDEHTQHHPLGRTRHLVLYDFAIHWFDLVNCVFAGRPAASVYTVMATRPGQLVAVPTLTTTVIDYGDAQVSIAMRASSRHEDLGGYHVQGTRGVLRHRGGALGGNTVQLIDASGERTIAAPGSWFPDGLIGSMADLLVSIEQGREPAARPESALGGLALCFAAIESAETGRPVDPAGVRRMHEAARAGQERR